MLTPEAIQSIVERIVAAASSPVKVMVFGSYARGEANEDSDLDLLVVEKAIADPTQEYAIAQCRRELRSWRRSVVDFRGGFREEKTLVVDAALLGGARRQGAV